MAEGRLDTLLAGNGSIVADETRLHLVGPGSSFCKLPLHVELLGRNTPLQTDAMEATQRDLAPSVVAPPVLSARRSRLRNCLAWMIECSAEATLSVEARNSSGTIPVTEQNCFGNQIPRLHEMQKP